MRIPDEKEYWLNNQVEPEVELDEPLSAMALFDLQMHLVEVIEKGRLVASRESVEYVAKFLQKDFI